ncbi:penicillin acylase family protein [Sphingomonas limnosediminicola]|uniref:Penicillin acylase family protein n=1 Tax=Sphingomonas limnosediminicola TaxID=940133 RepID=A0ABP7LCD0_9SPHN
MRKSFAAALFPLLLTLTAATLPIPQHGMREWRERAARVTIVRDDWGIAHIHGKTDADAVFGMIYAQAEDDFPRIEANYLTSLGRTAEAEGEDAIWQDLRALLYVSENELKADYRKSPQSMRRLMDAWADGLNYFLALHPQTKPRAIKRFEPWMALSFTEGSIGGDIERIDLKQLRAFYSGKPMVAALAPWTERQGSNGIAIAPKITANGNALLLINPHTSFYFRSEQQVTSGEGLNAYGASTWGQFFIYQGFNAHAGWMHTSSGVDSVDEFAEKVERRGKGFCYRYGAECRPLTVRPITIKFRRADGKFVTRSFTTYRTHHGPIVRAANGRWIAFAMMDRPVVALQQSFLRTKATDLASFLRIADFKANSSNDTLFADDRGEIAYLHPQFVPIRNDRFDYTKPVDGSDPATDWRGNHALGELPSVLNPASGWAQNTNAWPYRAAGPDSPKQVRFPRYMDTDGENYRGLHAHQLLTGGRGWTLERLQSAAYDSYQPGFAVLIPSLLRAYDALPKDGRKLTLAGPVAVLRSWDYRWSADSVAQSVAVLWGKYLREVIAEPASEPGNRKMMRLARDTSDEDKLRALEQAMNELRDIGHGRWQVPWGEINRFQRASNAIVQQFSDAAPSIPVPFAPAAYGSLASFEQRTPSATKRTYGTYGNSFVAVVEFGKRVRAHAITAGGESGDPASKHFNDEAPRYAAGNLREVYFYPDQLKGHTERTYHPGD